MAPSKVGEYRKQAQECLRLARAVLVSIAQGWQELLQLHEEVEQLWEV